MLLPRYVASVGLPPDSVRGADEPTLRQLLRFVPAPHVSDMASFATPRIVTSGPLIHVSRDGAGDSEDTLCYSAGFFSLSASTLRGAGVSASDSDAPPCPPWRAGTRWTSRSHTAAADATDATALGIVVAAPMLEEPLIWDPVEVSSFPLAHSACSACLGEISVVFNANNIWANVQTHARPHEMQWSFNDTTAWRPFFSLAPARAPPCRRRLYQSFEAAFFERLAAAVEREAMDAIVKARRRQHTPFNRRCSRALKDKLEIRGTRRVAGRAAEALAKRRAVAAAHRAHVVSRTC